MCNSVSQTHVVCGNCIEESRICSKYFDKHMQTSRACYFFTVPFLKWLSALCLHSPDKKLFTHGQCERGLEGLMLYCSRVYALWSRPAGCHSLWESWMWRLLKDMEPWTEHRLTDSSWKKGEGSAVRKESTGKENRKLCGIHNSSFKMNAFASVLLQTLAQCNMYKTWIIIDRT